MKNFKTIIILALTLTGCKKAELTNAKETKQQTVLVSSSKKVNAMAYSDVFFNINCPIDSIYIYVDSTYAGILTLNSYDLSTYNKLHFYSPPGHHNFYARYTKCNGGYWRGEFETTEKDTTTLFLDFKKMN